MRRGAIQATPDEAHTVHAEIHGLWPDTTYWYRFKAGPHMSRAGRTRTAPWPFARRPVKFAYVSCQNYSNGFYHAFGDLAQQDVELVVHLGDYIYEGPGTGVAAVRNHSSRRRSSRSATTGSATPSTRPTHSSRPRTPRFRG